MNSDKKVPKVPPLRFPQYDEDWATESLGNVFEYFPTSSYSWSELNYESGDALNIHYGLIHKGVLPTLTNVEKIELPFVNEGLNHQKYNRIKNGDIIFADASEDTSAVGKCVEIINTANKNVIAGSHTLHARNKTQNFAEGFLGYYLNALPFKSKMKKLAVGTKVYQISTKNISSLSIHYPTIDEQKKITMLLNLLDKNIETQSKIIEKYKSLMTSLTDKIFRMFNGAIVPFGDLIVTGKEGGTPDTKEQKFYENGDILWANIHDLDAKYLLKTKGKISKLGLANSSAWIIPTDSIIFSNGATIGKISINKMPVSTKQGILGLIPTEEINVEFLYYLMKTSKFRRQIKSLITTGTMPTVYFRDMSSGIIVTLPNKESQLIISTILGKLDNCIEKYNFILNKTIILKHELLKKLFI